MGARSKSSQDRMIDIMKYRWEFLRRNPSYQRDFEILERQEKAIDMPDGSFYDDLVERRGQTELTEEIEAFCAKWSIKIPLDPKLSFEDLIGREFLRGPASGKAKRVEKAPNWVYIERILRTLGGYDVTATKPVFWVPLAPAGREGKGQIDFQKIFLQDEYRFIVDLRYSKKEILSALEDVIDRLKKERKEAGLETKLSTSFSRYDHLLKIYDMKTEGENYPNIATTVYSREDGGKAETTRRVKEEFGEAQALVDGDYRHIR